jgi:HD-like signal output (HDOD) protein
VFRHRSDCKPSRTPYKGSTARHIPARFATLEGSGRGTGLPPPNEAYSSFESKCRYKIGIVYTPEKNTSEYCVTVEEPMGIFQKIKRHAAVAGGDFGAMFKGVELPPLPLAVNRLVSEMNKEHPSLDLMVRLISSETAMAAKVMQTVNSAFYGLRSPVTDIRRAVTLLGLKNIRNLALAYGTMAAIPKPEDDLFDHEAFWSDSLLRAHLAHTFAEAMLPGQGDDAFTASLLADVAIPILLSIWSDYYTPVVAEWLNTPKRLSQIEREHFGWDHAQAGAWIVRSWRFPDEIVCYIGTHNLTMAELESHELGQTLAVPIAIAAQSASVLKPDPARMARLHCLAVDQIALSNAAFADQIATIRHSFDEMLKLFGLQHQGAETLFKQLLAAAGFACQEAAAT